MHAGSYVLPFGVCYGFLVGDYGMLPPKGTTLEVLGRVQQPVGPHNELYKLGQGLFASRSFVVSSSLSS